MKSHLLCLKTLACPLILGVACSLAAAADSNWSPPNAPPASEVDAAGPNSPDDPGKTGIAVTVNGFDIAEAALDAEVARQLRSIKLPARIPAQRRAAVVEQAKKELRPRALENLIANLLVDEEIKKAKIVVTEEELVDRATKFAAQQGLSLDDFKVLLQAQGGSFEQWVQRMPFRKELAYGKLLEAQCAGRINITEDDTKKFYSENPGQFETPEQVRASHILIKPPATSPDTDPNQAKAEARTKAQSLLEQIKGGADFAQLARANSDDARSAACGGDLVNFFHRDSDVPPSFKDVAFKLEIGQVSDIVETPSGCHIIKVTARNDAGVISLEQAKDRIIDWLTQQKQRQIARQYIQSLKAKAQITYPPGKEPKPANVPAPASAAPVEPSRDANAVPAE